MTWAPRLKRVFNIDIETCARCGGHVKIIACIEAPVVIDKILAHLAHKDACGAAPRSPPILGATAGLT
jgi:hypothetical protein